MPSLLGHFLRLDNTVVRYLLRQGGVDPRLRHVGTLLEPSGAQRGSPMGTDEAHGLEAFVANAHPADESLILYFSGPRNSSKREMARALATAAGATLLAIDIDNAVASETDPGRLLEVAFREALLHGAVLFLEPLDPLLAPEHATLYGRLLDELANRPGVSVLAGTGGAPPMNAPRGVVDVPFPIPSHDERHSLWSARLAAHGIELPAPELDKLAGLFRLTPDQIADAVEVAWNRSRIRSSARFAVGSGGLSERPSLAELFEAVRSRSDAVLAGLARKIEPVHDWTQIVLPEDSVAQLREICAQVVQRHHVLDEWGFGRMQSLGKGVSALFAGPSGTGKTMAADIIARELGLVLYKIDLSGVVSKYIGETEKNLERIFTTAENTNAILFFDEADALFGKRSEVRDSHDRYANLEIAYLLQRIEQYDGVAILASNLRQNMDDAFVRRLQFVVDFPFPDEEQRARIWPLLFPEEAERSPDIDFVTLAGQFRITGGSIRNIVLGAAFLAATEAEPIGTRHVLHATRREYLKLGRVLTEAELGPYAGQVTL
jgi:AAA+ superfamily predicted ATPase